MLPDAFQPFLKDAPFRVMTRAGLESLFSSRRLDELCSYHRPGPCTPGRSSSRSSSS